jgi:hypothetical protein
MFFHRVTVYAIAFGGLLLNKVSISHIIYAAWFRNGDGFYKGTVKKIFGVSRSVL